MEHSDDQAASALQVEAIEHFYNTRLDFSLPANLANRLLSIRDYVRAVAHVLRREGHPVTRGHELYAAAFVINEDPLADYAAKWNARRFYRGTHNSTPRLRADRQFHLVYAKMLDGSTLQTIPLMLVST